MHLNPPPLPQHAPRAALDPARPPGASPAEPVQIWLLRHGQVENAFADQAYGARDVPLSVLGEDQTRAAAAALADCGVERVVCSPLLRALHMGRSIATACDVDLRVDTRLGEVDRGDWQVLEYPEYQARWISQAEVYWRDPANWRGHGGESELELSRRTWMGFEEAIQGVSKLAIATHRNVVRSILAVALGLPYSCSHALDLEPGHGALLVGDERGWTLACFGAGPQEGP